MDSEIQYNLKACKHATTFNELTFEVIIDDEPKNLTDTEISIDFRLGSTTGPVKKSMEVGSGITKTIPLAGKFKIDSFLVNMPVGIYYYDIKFKDAQVVKRYIYGTWQIVQNITS